MRVQNPNQIASWNFHIIGPDGEEVIIPPERGMPTIGKITNAVMSHIGVWDAHTDNEYSQVQRQLAEESGMEFKAYIMKLIEHQMCLRNKSSIKCWNDGAGDSIHNMLSKVDNYVEKTPEPIRRLVGAAIAKITPSRTRSFGGCAACGGSRVMSPNQDNLGRAGKVNRLLP